ncbi:MAG: ferrous iron transport protein B [Clostridiales Family XIII bacterium]|jgi:ferrous iron transport protein B|nr:ferrous iron transport protein B [Clostridiales Family XIII bacterium]
MATSTPITIALAGNPNSGKTTLFNALTGSNQYVGNWPGVTVEKKEGRLRGTKDVTIVDLPGIYSLSPYSPEEIVSRDFLVEQRPQAILNIVDGTNLERNLYLTTQLCELGIPVVVAVNMMDVMKKNGDKLSKENLSKALGCEVVEISALKGHGVTDAADKAVAAARAVSEGAKPPRHVHRFSGGVEHALAHIEEALLHDLPDEMQRWYAVKLFERDGNATEKLHLSPDRLAHIEEDITAAEQEFDDDSESIITAERYDYIGQIIDAAIKRRNAGVLTMSDKIDRIVTNRILALPIFAGVMFIVYFVSVTTVGGLVTDWANDGVFGEGWNLFGSDIFVPGIPVLLDGFLNNIGCAAWLHSLLLDGIVAGVGAVIGFVPQMLVLFAFLAFLEYCGYMARIAFIMDRIFRRFGLSGKSFIPILIGTGCGVPGIMASKTIESERDRRMTVMTTTFIPCSAKLPIIALVAGALFGGAPWVAPSAYFIGIAAIVCSGIILKKTRPFLGAVAPFVMELPAYHWPTVRGVLLSMWERGWSFIKKAGTIILCATIFVWFTSTYGWEGGAFGVVDMENSILAHIGNAIAWIFSPLGWGEWKAAVAAITGLIAKENVVGTFGILYGFAEVSEDGQEVWAALAASWTTLAAFSFLVFNLLCAPCFAAMGAIRREMNSAKWFFAAIGWQCGLAYVVALWIYQYGNLFSGGGFTAGTVAAFLLSAAFLWLLLKKPARELAGARIPSRAAAEHV